MILSRYSVTTTVSVLTAFCLSPLASRLQLRVIHQSNAGLSAARNTGIAVAQGDYILFVDSDDYLQPNVLGALMEQVEREQLDVLRFDYQNVRQIEAGEYEVFQPNKYPHQVDTCREVVDGETYLDERMGYACYACQFVINRELTGTFTPGIHYEDTEWLPRMMLAAKRVNSTSIVVYNYLVRQGSITQAEGNKEKLRKNVKDFLFVIESLSKQKAISWSKLILVNKIVKQTASINKIIKKAFRNMFLW